MTEPVAALAALVEMRDRGLITPEEYEAKKAEVMARIGPATVPPPPSGRPAQRGHPLRNVAVVIVLIGAVFYLTKPSSSPSTAWPPAAPADTTVTLTYAITGTARAVSLTYANATGDTEQKDSVAVPARLSFSVPHGSFFYISAQNQDDTGDVTCTVTAGGATIKTAHSTGAYVIASCSGTVP